MTKRNSRTSPEVTYVNGAIKTFDEIYEEAKARIMSKALAHAQKYPNSPYSGRGLVELEKALKAEYAKLGVDIKDEFKNSIPIVMRKFYDRAKEDISKHSVNKIIGDIDTKRIDYFMSNTFDSVAGATTRMAQTHVRELRKIAADVMRQTSLTGATRKEVSRMMLERAMNVPNFQFIDNIGSKWNAKSYFEMLARTELMSAGRYSYQCRCEEDGYDAVRLTVSGHSCPKCARYENRLFSLSGNTPGLPSYDKLKADGVFHPNCTHSFTAVPDFIRNRDFNPDGTPKKGFNSPENKDELHSGAGYGSKDDGNSRSSSDSGRFRSAFASNDKKFNEAMAAEIAAAPEELQQAVLALPPVKNIERTHHCSYVPSRDTIRLTPNVAPAEMLHEYGHYIDIHSSKKAGKLRSLNFEVIVEYYEETLVKDGMRQKLFTVLDSVPASAEKGRLLDYFGSITKNAIGYGHDKGYLSNKKNQQYEVFANMIALYARQGATWEIIEEHTPKMATVLRQILRRIR
jgi:hypothetical protein